MQRLVVYLLILFGGLGLGYYLGANSKNSSPKSENEYSQDYRENKDSRDFESSNKKNNQKNEKRESNDYEPQNTDASTDGVPNKVLEVLDHVNKTHEAIDGYVGGRKFKNLEGLLPKKSSDGRRINYQEWDVNPKMEGRNRGAERLVTGDDGSAYFTEDHYRTFKKIQ
jgi:ribonuclease T1